MLTGRQVPGAVLDPHTHRLVWADLMTVHVYQFFISAILTFYVLGSPAKSQSGSHAGGKLDSCCPGSALAGRSRLSDLIAPRPGASDGSGHGTMTVRAMKCKWPNWRCLLGPDPNRRPDRPDIGVEVGVGRPVRAGVRLWLSRAWASGHDRLPSRMRLYTSRRAFSPACLMTRSRRSTRMRKAWSSAKKARFSVATGVTTDD